MMTSNISAHMSLSTLYNLKILVNKTLLFNSLGMLKFLSCLHYRFQPSCATYIKLKASAEAHNGPCVATAHFTHYVLTSTYQVLV